MQHEVFAVGGPVAASRGKGGPEKLPYACSALPPAPQDEQN